MGIDGRRRGGWRELSVVASMALLFLSGCASLQDAQLPSGVAVERVASAHAEITHVRVRVTAAGTMVEGELRPIPVGRFEPPGVVTVEILDAGGVSLGHSHGDYHRSGQPVKPLQRFVFTVVVPGQLPERGTVRVTHQAEP